MDILIPDTWLREYLKTKAASKDLQKYLSLCGPSVERIREGKTGPVYAIEVTTNRVDSASVYGIAREAAAILPRFKINATLEQISPPNPKPEKETVPLEIKTSPELTRRVMAVVLEVKNSPSPNWMQERLEDAEIRSLGSLIDITNYVMQEIGHPTHVFDYDRIASHKLVFRHSKKDEKITTLDGREHTLLGGDVVIDDGTGQIIDLPGIMGTQNSVVTANTERVVFFLDNVTPQHIRKTSMATGIRTQAASMNEKGVDPELAKTALLRGIQLYQEICNAKVVSTIYDIYPSPYKTKKVALTTEFITTRLGVAIPVKEIVAILNSLDLKTSTKGTTLIVSIPSYRAQDIAIPEDIVEEIARIYGYHNLPSQVMSGPLPQPLPDSPFEFEKHVKQSLRALGAVEVYTLSLVSKQMTKENSLRLKNPLGADSEYLRQSLAPSLVTAMQENKREEKPFHLFEMANVYIPASPKTASRGGPTKGSLPEEKMTLAGIFSANYNYREAKGIIETFLEEIRVPAIMQPKNDEGYAPGQSLEIKVGSKVVGRFGYREDEYVLYWEFDTEALCHRALMATPFMSIPKHPAQVEDITLVLPQNTLLGNVVDAIKNFDKTIVSVDLVATYENTQTLRIAYQHPEKTLRNEEITTLRNQILTFLAKKFEAKVK